MSILAGWGFLTLIDSINDMNRLKCKLFTLMDRDEYNSSHLFALILFFNEDGDIICFFLGAVKKKKFSQFLLHFLLIFF